MTDTKVTHDYDQETLAAAPGDTLASAPRRAGARPPRDTGLQPGDRVGRYVIESVLGQGGMGAVLSARDPDLDRRVAIKVLHPHSRQGDGLTGGPQRLLREAQAMAKLAHPSVVTVHDVGVVGDRLFIAMEMIDGGDLRSWLRAEARGWREILAAFIRAGEGLAAAHAAGIIHRDFKPENVMVARNGRVCVGDFGLAAATESASPAAHDLQSSWLTTAGTLTLPGAVLGTPAYMAPEQMMRGELTEATDVFSFCVALYEALYGHRPFRGDTIGALYLAIQRGQVLAPGPAASKIPRRLERLLRRGLHYDPKARPSLQRELLPQLRALLERRRRRTFAAVAALALAALAPVLVLYDPQPEVDCDRADPELAEITAPARLAAIERAFAGTGSLHHADTWQRVAAALAEFTERWQAARVDACEATHRRHEQSPELLELRDACFARHLRDLDRLLTLYSDPDPKVIDNAVALIKGLPSARECGPAEVISATAVEPPPTPQLAQLDAQIRESRILSRAHRFDRAIELLDQVFAQLDALDPDVAPRLRARALIARARVAYLDSRRDTDEWLTRALGAALSAGDDRGFAESAADQVGNLGRDPKARELWRALGEAALARHGGDDSVRAKLLTNYGNTLRSGDQVHKAVLVHTEALELRRRNAVEDESSVADAIFNLSADYATLEQIGRATVLLTEAVEIWRRCFGPKHPRMITAMRNLAMFHKYEGDYRRGLELATAAYELALRTYGDNKPQLISPLNLVANLHVRLGDAERGLEHYQRALEINRSSPDHQAIADIDIQMALASLEVDRRDTAAAAKWIERASEAGGRDRPPGDAFWQAKSQLEADIALIHGDLDEAEAAYARNRESMRGAEHVHSLVYGDIALIGAEIDRRRGRHARALTTLAALAHERPLALKHPHARAAFHSIHAQIFAARSPARARAHAEAGLTAVAELGPIFEWRRAELRHLLAELSSR